MRIVYLVAFLSAVGCSGDGCSCMQPIPGGFPSAERTPNAAQVRVSQTGLAALSADPQALIEGLTGGPLTFDVPPSCGGTPAVCCPGGNPQSPCGPIAIDMTLMPGDDPRLVLTPVQGASRLDLTVRARVQTQMGVPVSMLGADCELVLDTNPGADPDIQIDAPISFVQDPDTGTTRVEVGDVAISRFSEDDYAIEGNFACTLIDWGSQLFMDSLTGTFTDAIKSAISDQTCKACPSGDVAECGPFAAACTDNVCMKANDTCLQELGVSGRLVDAFAGFSPGTTGAIDLYEVAGGYATTNSGGLALGLLGGMLPAGVERDRCGPPATAPAPVSIPVSSYFQGNARPDTGAPFDIAIGVHQNQLDRFAYSAYDGGLLCLTIGTSAVDLLTTGSLGLFIPSLDNLQSEDAPMAIGLRPQAPPTIVLGPNTFLDDGQGNVSVDQPLLDITFQAMEVDFFAMVEHQFIRVFTLVSDVRLPIGLQVGATGELIPVLGDLGDAFTNISVENSEPLLETPESLADVFPTILELALGQLGDLGSFDVPELGGLAITVTEITSVDNNAFLAIFGELAPAQMAARVETSARIDAVMAPGAEVLADTSRWDPELRPRVDLALGGSDAGLEWQVRVDGGMWSAWSPHPRRTIAPHAFWLQGRHRLEVRARRAGEPWSTDLTPVVLAPTIGQPRQPDADLAPYAAPFHGQAEAGCSCAASGDAGAGNLLLVAFVASILILGPRARARARARSVLFLLLAGLLPACNCGGDPPCGDQDCLPGEVARGAVGKYNGVASDGERTVVSTYDQGLGDLVVVDVIAGSDPVYTAVDGVPDETPTYDPGTYRGGVATPGPNVGAWTSIALHDGLARVAYQDRDTLDLKFALERDSGWTTYVLDPDNDAGLHASLAIDGNGAPVIAYAAPSVDDGAGGIETQLRLARSAVVAPEDGSAWTITTIARGPASCGGLCAGGTECVADDAGVERCVSPTGDCASPCADGETCVAAACVAVVPPVMKTALPGGAGLFATVVVLDDGRLVVVHYDESRTALVLLAETSAGSSSFQEVVLDGADGADRGMWATAVASGSTVHVAYQDARGDQVFYTSWNGAAGAIELVDDGVRAGDRPHNVGAGAAIFLDGTTPKIAYQDGLASDLVLATRGGTGWTHEGIATGTLLDGFHVAATSDGPWLVWDSMDITRTPPTGLEVREQP